MPLKRQWFTPGRRIDQIGKLGAHPFFTRDASQAGAASTHPSTRPRGLIARLSENAGALFSLALSVLLLVFIVGFVVAFVNEMRRDTIILDTFQVPKDLQDRGFNSLVISEHLLDEIRMIQKRAGTQRARRQLDNVATMADLQVAGAGFSMGALVRYARQSLGWPASRIGGEITREGDTLHFVVREHGRERTSTLHVRGPSDDMEALIRMAARAVVQQADPYLLANYFYNVERRERKFPQTLEAIQYVLRTHPTDDDPWALNLWGLVLADQRQFDAATDKYRAALALRPGFAPALSNWAIALHQQGRHDEALARMEEVQKANPQWAFLMVSLAEEYANRGRYDEAIAWCERALQTQPGLIFAYTVWADALRWQNRLADSEAVARRAVDIAPDSQSALFALWTALWLTDRTDEAADIARRLQILDPDSEFALATMAATQIALGQHGEAETAFARLAARDADDDEARLGWGEALAAQGRYTEALAKFNESITVEARRRPHRSALPHLGAARALEGVGRMPEAWLQLEMAGKLQPAFPRVYREWGRMLERQGRVAEAQQKFAQADALAKSAHVVQLKSAPP